MQLHPLSDTCLEETEGRAEQYPDMQNIPAFSRAQLLSQELHVPVEGGKEKWKSRELKFSNEWIQSFFHLCDWFFGVVFFLVGFVLVFLLPHFWGQMRVSYRVGIGYCWLKAEHRLKDFRRYPNLYSKPVPDICRAWLFVLQQGKDLTVELVILCWGVSIQR